MDRKIQRKQIENVLLWVYGGNGILDGDQMKIFLMVEGLPKRYFDLVIGKIVQGKKWSQMEGEYFYSERRMRSLLGEAMEMLEKKISTAISKGEISQETVVKFFN